MKTWRGWLLAAGAAMAVGALAPAVALADPAACPAAPGAYGGSDAVVAELRDLRADVAAACAATTERQDAAAVHTDVLPAKLDVLHDDLVGDVGVHVASGPGVGSALNVDTGADPSNAQTVHLADADQDWLAGNETALRADLWFLVGLLCCLPFSYFFLRTVLP